jgi:hypothetical protein
MKLVDLVVNRQNCELKLRYSGNIKYYNMISKVMEFSAAQTANQPWPNRDIHFPALCLEKILYNSVVSFHYKKQRIHIYTEKKSS